MLIVILLTALVIVSALAFYAGSLLFKLKKQNLDKQNITNKRIQKITESIQTIAKAVQQEQCNLSEASIRLCHLLEGLPIIDKPDYSIKYPNLHALFNEIKDLPTHQDRKNQTKLETRKQDYHRQRLEDKLAENIKTEIDLLTNFCSGD